MLNLHKELSSKAPADRIIHMRRIESNMVRMMKSGVNCID